MTSPESKFAHVSAGLLNIPGSNVDDVAPREWLALEKKLVWRIPQRRATGRGDLKGN